MSKRVGRLRRVSRVCATCRRRMRRTIRNHYQYLESGLANVYLNGVVVYECGCGEEFVELPRVHALHALIAQRLLTKASFLDGPEIRFIRKFVGLKAIDVAEMLNVTPTTVSRWETGDERIGKTNDQLFRFRMVLRVTEERKTETDALYREVANGYLDLLNEIADIRSKEEPREQPVSIEAEEVNTNRLILRRFDMPTVIVDIAEPQRAAAAG